MSTYEPKIEAAKIHAMAIIVAELLAQGIQLQTASNMAQQVVLSWL